ncbi:MAG: hypothetical protein Q8L08_07460 [Candidatus Nanopelagicaceae bacterium]|nr:hypothetical protein [Candidatus Nanopelagicaceae bacterium]
MSGGKKVLVGLLSTLAWPLLLIALLVTSANLIVNNLNHVGSLAATVVKEVSANPNTLSSIIDEFTKNADPNMAKEIKKNRARIERTVASLGASSDFQDAISSTLNQISQAVLSGASSVNVDFAPLATLVAEKVNEAAKSTVISKKILADIKPTSIDLSQQSTAIAKVKNLLHQALLIWVLWIVLLIGLSLLIGRRIMRIYGAHLVSIGIIGLTLRSMAPVFAQKAITSSDSALYAQQMAPKLLETLLSPIMTLSIAAVVLGIALIAVGRFVKDHAALQGSEV